MTTTEMNDCKDFVPWTHPAYEDAGCAGCAYFLIFSDSDMHCQIENKLVRKKKKCKAFGLVDLVIRND